MIKKFIAIVYLSFCICSFSCKPAINTSRAYFSNFYELGFFSTKVRLKPDSTLQYIFAGDLIYDSTTGHYSIRGRDLYINFDKQAQDPNKLKNWFDYWQLNTAVFSGDTIRYKARFYIGR